MKQPPPVIGGRGEMRARFQQLHPATEAAEQVSGPQPPRTIGGRGSMLPQAQFQPSPSDQPQAPASFGRGRGMRMIEYVFLREI